ncbi:MAG: zinc ribbon domain-containing protein [Phycisphaerae bacterium]|nr:zinc ribbon domain-containing protein [Phycisphaerae bacterium]
MPTYEYECTKCGSVQDLFQRITEKPKRKLDCEICGERTPVRRLIGAGGGIVFKGSGFYATDYRSESYKKARQADQPTTENKTENKSDSAKPSEPKSPKTKPVTQQPEGSVRN